ncbi:MAG: hypothetical protein ACD_75C01803G0001, partial [uncultured bacterium]
MGKSGIEGKGRRIDIDDAATHRKIPHRLHQGRLFIAEVNQSLHQVVPIAILARHQIFCNSGQETGRHDPSQQRLDRGDHDAAAAGFQTVESGEAGSCDPLVRRERGIGRNFMARVRQNLFFGEKTDVLFEDRNEMLIRHDTATGAVVRHLCSKPGGTCPAQSSHGESLFLRQEIEECFVHRQQKCRLCHMA